MGTTLILGIGSSAKNDAWLAGITGIIMSIPMVLIYARIQILFPGKDLFDILQLIYGRILGSIVSTIYILYAFHLGSLVLRNFGEFMNTAGFPETPMLVSLIFMGMLCAVSVRLGIEVIGRFCTALLPLLLSIIAIVLLFSLSAANFEYLKPILGSGIMPVIKGGFSAFSFPFAETVLFLGVTFSLNTDNSSYKVYLFSIIFAGIIIVIVTIRNIAILGNLLPMLYFPSHIAVSLISIMDFIQRMELTVVIIFIDGVFVKASICLFVTCRGITRVLKLTDYRSIVIPMGILMVYFSYTVYDNIMQMSYWAFKVYPYYAFPMQVILPIVIWISAEVKRAKANLSHTQ